jgi:hypothetical protein
MNLILWGFLHPKSVSALERELKLKRPSKLSMICQIPEDQSVVEFAQSRVEELIKCPTLDFERWKKFLSLDSETFLIVDAWNPVFLDHAKSLTKAIQNLTGKVRVCVLCPSFWEGVQSHWNGNRSDLSYFHGMSSKYKTLFESLWNLSCPVDIILHGPVWEFFLTLLDVQDLVPFEKFGIKFLPPIKQPVQGLKFVRQKTLFTEIADWMEGKESIWPRLVNSDYIWNSSDCWHLQVSWKRFLNWVPAQNGRKWINEPTTFAQRIQFTQWMCLQAAV